MSTSCLCAVPQQLFVSLLSVTWLSSKWWVILSTALSVFLLLTFVYILEHVPNCLWLNIAQTGRLRFIDTKEAGRREWLVGHLCLLAADSDVIDDVHVSVQWPWCVPGAAVQKHGWGTDPWQHSLFFPLCDTVKAQARQFVEVMHSFLFSLAFYRNIPWLLRREPLFFSWWESLCWCPQREIRIWNMLTGLWPTGVLSSDPFKKDILKNNAVTWSARKFRMEDWKVSTIRKIN